MTNTEALVEIAKQLAGIRQELQKKNMFTMKNRKAEFSELLSSSEKKWLNTGKFND